MISEFKQISNNYKNCVGKKVNDPYAQKIIPIFDQLKKQIEHYLQKKQLQGFICKYSIGKGNITNYPWIAIMDKDITTSAKKGVYIVFGIKINNKVGFTLNLSFGADQFIERNNFKYEEVKDLVNFYREECKRGNEYFYKNPIDWDSSRKDRDFEYERATIFSKSYDLNDNLIDDCIFNDLNKMIEVYREACILWKEDKIDQINVGNEKFEEQQFVEGQELKKPIKYHGRNSNAKEAYLLSKRELKEIGDKYIYIYRCELCGKFYLKADHVGGIIDVHHLNPIRNGERGTDINKDLKCLCPNCHRFVHSIKGYEKKTWDEIIKLFNETKKLVD